MIPVAAWACTRSQRSGDEGTRTLNPRRAKAVLYQLSYVPGSRRDKRAQCVSDARSGGLAPELCLRLGGTLTLDDDQSNQTDEQQRHNLLHDGSPPAKWFFFTWA
jgi:hypothetical protein